MKKKVNTNKTFSLITSIAFHIVHFGARELVNDLLKNFSLL